MYENISGGKSFYNTSLIFSFLFQDECACLCNSWQISIQSISEWWIYEATQICSLCQIDPVAPGLNPCIIPQNSTLYTCTFTVHIYIYINLYILWCKSYNTSYICKRILICTFILYFLYPCTIHQGLYCSRFMDLSPSGEVEPGTMEYGMDLHS